MKSIILLIAAYLIGSIPTAYLVVKLIKGVDIRTVGSGNVGATNAGRVLEFYGFLLVFIIDMLKGFLPVYLTKLFFGDTLFLYIVALCTILGHTFTIFLNFKGGKGVATGVGVYLALSPLNLLYAFIAFILMVGIFRMVSLGSIVGAIVLSATMWLGEQSIILKIFTTLLAIFVIYKHKENIKRIINGTEKKIGEKVNI